MSLLSVHALMHCLTLISECLFCSLVQVASVPRNDEENGAKASSRARRASESDTVFEDTLDKNVDILQMLSKAQDEYDKVCCCAILLSV